MISHDSPSAVLHRGSISRIAAALIRAEAFTLGRHIFFSKSAAHEVATASSYGSELLAHELVHVEQYRSCGVPAFLARYFGEYLAARARGRSHRDAYLAIGFEREARETGAARPSPSAGPDVGAERPTSGSRGDLPPGA